MRTGRCVTPLKVLGCHQDIPVNSPSRPSNLESAICQDFLNFLSRAGGALEGTAKTPLLHPLQIPLVQMYSAQIPSFSSSHRNRSQIMTPNTNILS